MKEAEAVFGIRLHEMAHDYRVHMRMARECRSRIVALLAEHGDVTTRKCIRNGKLQDFTGNHPVEFLYCAATSENPESWAITVANKSEQVKPEIGDECMELNWAHQQHCATAYSLHKEAIAMVEALFTEEGD